MRAVMRAVGRRTRLCPLLVTLLREVFQITTRMCIQKMQGGTGLTDAV
jgi:hypothetical protein